MTISEESLRLFKAHLEWENDRFSFIVAYGSEIEKQQLADSAKEVGHELIIIQPSSGVSPSHSFNALIVQLEQPETYHPENHPLLVDLTGTGNMQDRVDFYRAMNMQRANIEKHKSPVIFYLPTIDRQENTFTHNATDLFHIRALQIQPS